MRDTRNASGLSSERLYAVYNGMISRCHNKKHPHFDLWGGRGIIVCDEWRENYQAFRKWSLENGYDFNKDRKEQSIDRIDNDGNYEPDNCRWFSMKVQRKNQRERENVNRKSGNGYKYNWTFEGITKSAIEWCEIFNVSYPMVIYRINKKHMTPFEALTKPVTRCKKPNAISKEQVIELRERGMSFRQIANFLGCSKTTVRRRLDLVK